MKYLLLADFKDGSQEYWAFAFLKDAEDKLENIKRYSNSLLVNLYIVETKIVSHVPFSDE